MIICLTGMHRSGTSLMSSYLEHCKINMGQNLIGAMRGNMRGHYEDADFVQLHDEILAENNCHMYSPKNNLKISDTRKKQAIDIIKCKQSHAHSFGWKDPRSSLFLDLWQQTEPEIKFLLLYRDPFSVIDSLRRRGTDKRIRILPWLPATAWLRYNSDLLKFHQKTDTNTVIINIDGFNKTHQYASKKLEAWLEQELNKPYTDVFHKKEFTTSINTNKSTILKFLDRYYYKQLYDLYNKLENEALVNSLSTP